ncbi:MAG: chemotaxis protein CheW, partial [Intestinibacillus sp.]
QQNDVSRITIEQSDIVLSANEKHKMLVTFVVNDQLFGIDQDFVMEVVGSEKAFFFHGASGKIRMAVPYKERYLAAINLRALFNQAVPSLGNPYLLVIGRQDDLQVALEVDDLNSVLEVNASDIKEAPNISELQSCFSGVACFQSKAGNRFLFVLNHDALLSRKELEGIMGQLDKIKETVSQIDAPQ